MRNASVRVVIGLATILIAAGIVFAGGFREDSYVRRPGSFSAIHMSTPGRVEYVQGPSHSVSISGPSSAVDAVRVHVQNGVLFIEGRNWRFGRPVDRLVFTVTAPVISEMVTSSSGSMHADRLTAENIRLVTSSSGSIEVDRLAVEQARVALNSSGRITLSGTAGDLELRVSSSGNFNGRNLSVENAQVSVSSSGDAHVRVRGTLEGGVSSSGDLFYYGDPRTVRVNTSSSGGVRNAS